MEENKLIKVEGKDVKVDIKSIEDILNSINFVTKKMEEANEKINGGVDAGTNEYITTSLQIIKKNVNEIKDEVIPINHSIDKKLDSLPSENTIKALLFEVEKLGNIEKTVKKIKSSHIFITAIVTAVVTVSALSYSKLDDAVFYNYVKSQISKNSWVLDKKIYELKQNTNTQVVFKKIK